MPNTASAPQPDEMLLRLSQHFRAMMQVFDLGTTQGWAELSSAVPFLDPRNGTRMKAAFAKRAAWVLVEDNYIDRDYRDTFSHIFSKRFATPPTRCQRLHFFNNRLTKPLDMDSLAG